MAQYYAVMDAAVRDRAILYSSAFVRSTAVGVTGVVAAIALRERGIPVVQIGVIVGTGLAGAAVATALLARIVRNLGRRSTLVLFGLLSAGGYVALAFAPPLLLLLPLAFGGMVNAMGRDRGAAAALEQAVLPETTTPERRTWTFAWYNVVLDGGHMTGAALAAIPALFVAGSRLSLARAHALLFSACAASLFATAIACAALSPRIEEAAVERDAPRAVDVGVVLRKLVFLFALDSLGSGFLNSALIAFWFFQRYGLSEAQVAGIFAAARVLNAVSHMLAAWLARRIGLVNTMVLTHLPSSLLLMGAPLMSTPAAATALFLGREALVEMDVPTRQSYMMAIVPASARTRVSGVTNVTRLIGWAVGPLIAGALMQTVASAAPLFVGGSIKILYDVLLYRAFRHVHAPEEGRIQR
jgi:MFS family permease